MAVPGNTSKATLDRQKNTSCDFCNDNNNTHTVTLTHTWLLLWKHSAVCLGLGRGVVELFALKAQRIWISFALNQICFKSN